MTPEQIGTRLVALLGDAGTDPGETGTDPGETGDGAAGDGETGNGPAGDGQLVAGVTGGGHYARASVDVPPATWPTALRTARDDTDLDCDFFDWLSAVDELDDGFTIVAHLWSTRARHGLLLRTRVPRADPVLPSVVDVFPGADWHERETHEMFGVRFDGHPGLTPLLLPPEFEGHPLRKEFVLAARVAKPWPGAKEPGEPGGGGARRAPMRPPGVPLPTEWGPQAARPARDDAPGGGKADSGTPDGGTA
ncbi:NADH-quinone oxidoreductase subunit C [Solwaraspora sp. WMMB335]|uniref:NADH-quinone oxidoreductase subunit C n=1 Tax=Solwaraspora sp. WMMB335 TaxID=3404118 RepID=UPI003B930DC2